MNILFIKQGVTSYDHIEAGIEDAATRMPDLRFRMIHLKRYYFSQTSPLREQHNAIRMNRAISDMLARILEDDSETILLLNGFVLQWYRRDFFKALKQAGKTLITWQIDDPYYIDKTMMFVAELDAIFTVDSAALPAYAEVGKRASFLPLACFPRLHHGFDDLAETYRCDVCFIGAPFAGSWRTRLIDELAGCLPRWRTKIIGATDIDSWKTSLSRYQELKDCIVDGRVGPDEAARYFAGARINLNVHKDSYGHPWDKNARKIEARSPCERTFAIAGCGGFQLIDDTRPDLPALFEIGKDLVTFSDARDLEAKIDYYLGHEDERLAIARSAQATAYARHTYEHRLRTLLEWIKGPG